MPTGVGILALIKDRDATHVVPAKDAMCYKRGDFVQLFPPGTEYVVPCAEPFYLIEVTGVVMTFAEIQARYQQMEYDAVETTKPVRRRLYWVDLDSLPTANKNDLAATRYTSIAWNKAKSSVKNKVTGQPEG
jgi:hypothetical protein